MLPAVPGIGGNVGGVNGQYLPKLGCIVGHHAELTEFLDLRGALEDHCHDNVVQVMLVGDHFVVLEPAESHLGGGAGYAAQFQHSVVIVNPLKEAVGESLPQQVFQGQ